MSLESLKARWEQAGEAERVARRRLDAEIIRVAGTGAGQREIARRLGWYPQRVAKVLEAAEADAVSIISDDALRLTDAYREEVEQRLWKGAPADAAEMMVHWAPAWAREAFTRARPDPGSGIKAIGWKVTEEDLAGASWLVSDGLVCPIIGRRGGRIRYARPDGIWYEVTYEQIRGRAELDLVAKVLEAA